MDEHIFRQYDIRGKVGTQLMYDQVYNLTCAIAAYIIKYHSLAKTVVVGMDGRVHSPEIAQQVSSALCDSGFNVVMLGVCPTPVFYFALHTLSVDAGIMVTASHNGAEYNGMKINIRTDSVWGEGIQEIKRMYQQGVKRISNTQGMCVLYPLNDTYISFLVDHFPQLHGCEYRMIFDCGNGAAGVIMPQLIEAMQWKNASLLYEQVDGTFPHHEADPTIAENMADLRTAVLENNSDVGIGFDGDADRMIPITHRGVMMPGDHVLALYAQEIIAQTAGAGVVFDGKCSLIVSQLVSQAGGVPRQVPSGHAIIKDAMKRYKALCAGELSGHFFFADSYFGFDDGIYAALRLICIMHSQGKSLELLRQSLPVTYSTPEIRLTCPDNKKFNVIESIQHNVTQYATQNSDVELQLFDGVRMVTPEGWALIRASHTQDVVSVRLEAFTQTGLVHMKNKLLPLLGTHFDEAVLQIYFM